MSNLIGLDFETYSAVNLVEHGLERYVDDPTFRPLIACLHWVDDLQIHQSVSLDFTSNEVDSRYRLVDLLADRIIVAHNAGFERRVLQAMGYDFPAGRFIDSAVVARVAGAASKLEAAAPQLLGVDKMAVGMDLIKLFSIPGKYQEKNGNLFFDRGVAVDHPTEWQDFIRYCALDAKLSFDIVERNFAALTDREMQYQTVTMEMNQVGWHVDVEMVEEMNRRYLENKERALETFRSLEDEPDLNFNSSIQLKKWCLERGVRSKSFDEKNVERLIAQLRKKLLDPALDPVKQQNYMQVLHMLETKQTLGGSSLKKLRTILDTVGYGGRLRDQYLHCGAGQTLRTTGRSVQMQNLKRIGEPDDMRELLDPWAHWDNTKLARNLRQLFTASDPNGFLIVGDFSSIESRGLAYLAGEDWKLKAYKRGEDMYKVLATKIFNVAYGSVSKDQRQAGKVGELSCGYGAAGLAVREFATNMGVTMSEGEASTLVYDWREANPMIVALWQKLDDLLHEAMETSKSIISVELGTPGLVAQFQSIGTPVSLLELRPDAKSLQLVIRHHGAIVLKRVFHGCYQRGRNITYYKPSELKGGDLWKDWFIHPKTGQKTYYSLYGGKLSGILTQSFCREIFFESLTRVHHWQRNLPTVQLVGQFHDEIVLDWVPGPMPLEEVIGRLRNEMTSQPYAGFPMAAEIKFDYRYTK